MVPRRSRRLRRPPVGLCAHVTVGYPIRFRFRRLSSTVSGGESENRSFGSPDVDGGVQSTRHALDRSGLRHFPGVGRSRKCGRFWRCDLSPQSSDVGSGAHRRLAGLSAAETFWGAARGALSNCYRADTGSRRHVGGPIFGRGFSRALGQGSGRIESRCVPAPCFHRPRGAAHSKPAGGSGAVDVKGVPSTVRVQPAFARNSREPGHAAVVPPPNPGRSPPPAPPLPPSARCMAVETARAL